MTTSAKVSYTKAEALTVRAVEVGAVERVNNLLDEALGAVHLEVAAACQS